MNSDPTSLVFVDTSSIPLVLPDTYKEPVKRKKVVHEPVPAREHVALATPTVQYPHGIAVRVEERLPYITAAVCWVATIIVLVGVSL